jgi:DNA polymerase-3 subunit delta'
MSLETPTFQAIRGQDQAVALLRGLVAHARVPSALLFAGPAHVGKRTTALALAKALNCRTAPGAGCGSCPACRKIDEGVHPDVEVIAADGQFIRIQQIRAIDAKLALIPFEARKRVIVLAAAERMHLESANALLKTLEEPPGDTLLVLCTEQPARLPDTVRSRCMRVRFAPLDEATVDALLPLEDFPEGPPRQFLRRFAQGQLRPELAEPARVLALRDALLDALAQVPGGDYERIMAHHAAWSASDDWRLVLELLETWLRDVVVLHSAGAAAPLIHEDQRETLTAWCRRLAAAQAHAWHQQVLATRDGLLLNVNKALALDALWLGMRAAASVDGGGSHP